MLLVITSFIIKPIDEVVEPDADASADKAKENAEHDSSDNVESHAGAPRPKRGFAGKPCKAMRDDGRMCGAIISRYNLQLEQICNACMRRFSFRNKKPVFFQKSYELKLR